MSVQVYKNGIVHAGGSGVGENIIAGTSSNEILYTYPSSSYKDWFSSITTIIPSGSQYTLSFYAKSTVDGDKIRTHYYSPNTTTTCVSSQGTTKTATDGNMDFTLSTEWKRYWVIYTQTETIAVKHVICPRLLSGQGTGTISIKYVKLELGSHPTPWTPAPSDYNIGSDHGFIETDGSITKFYTDFAEANEFIEY